jgi:hypothetical protein
MANLYLNKSISPIKIISFGLIALLALFLRFYKLGNIPDGLQQDESSLGYNAYSILLTGKDEHNEKFPQNFKAFGEYKLPGYIYASVIPISIFGLNPFSIRFISAFTGFLSVIIVFFLTKKIVYLFTVSSDLPKMKLIQLLPYIVMLFLSINPWHLQFSRAAFEVMLANFLILFGIWVFLKGISDNHHIYILTALITFSLSLYTYNIARAFAPFLLIALVIIFRKQLLRQTKWKLCTEILVLLFCLYPFVYGAINHGGIDSTTGTIITTSAKVQSKLLEIRGYFIEWPRWISRIFINYWSLTFWEYLNNIISHFSVSYYFINGGNDSITSIGTTGLWYIFELPLIVWGIIYLSSKNSITRSIILSWIIGLILITSITREPPQATRTFFLVFPVTFCSGIGVMLLINKIISIRFKKIRLLIFGVTGLICSYIIFFYFASYYTRFPIYAAKHWRTGDRQVAYYITTHNTYKKIIVDSDSGLMYTSLLTYLTYPPANFQSETHWSENDSEGFSHPITFGKYEFRKIDWSKDMLIPNALIITCVNGKPLEIPPLISIYYPKRPVAFNIGQKIISYPVEEIAYVLVDTGISEKK